MSAARGRRGQTLVVLPDDGMTPLLEAIRGAKESILVKMFLFTEPRLIRALAAARRRGVRVRVMLNPARRSGESDNDDAKRRLRRNRLSRSGSPWSFQPTAGGRGLLRVGDGLSATYSDCCRCSFNSSSAC